MDEYVVIVREKANPDNSSYLIVTTDEDKPRVFHSERYATNEMNLTVEQLHRSGVDTSKMEFLVVPNPKTLN